MDPSSPPHYPPWTSPWRHNETFVELEAAISVYMLFIEEAFCKKKKKKKSCFSWKKKEIPLLEACVKEALIYGPCSLLALPCWLFPEEIDE